MESSRPSKRRWVWNVVALALFAGFLTFCVDWVGRAPPSASAPTHPNANGLAELFERECIRQISRGWVGPRSKRVIGETCGGDESSDCASNVDWYVFWEAPTTNGSKVFVEMSWPQPGPPPPRGPLECSIYVGDNLAGELRAAAETVKIGGQSPSPPVKDVSARVYDDVTWKFGDKPPTVVTLRHHHPEEAYNILVGTRWIKSEPDDRSVDQTKYPWELIYEPPSWPSAPDAAPSAVSTTTSMH
jgi:hypothetical protein